MGFFEILHYFIYRKSNNTLKNHNCFDLAVQPLFILKDKLWLAFKSGRTYFDTIINANYMAHKNHNLSDVKEETESNDAHRNKNELEDNNQIVKSIRVDPGILQHNYAKEETILSCSDKQEKKSMNDMLDFLVDLGCKN